MEAILREADGLVALRNHLLGQNDHKAAVLNVLSAAAADSEENCAVLVSLGIFNDIAPFFTSNNITLVCAALGLISVLFASNRAEPAGSLQLIMSLATGDNDRVREGAARALANVVRRQPARETLYANGLQAVLPPLISSPAPAVSRAGLALLQAVCTQDANGAANVLADSVARPVLNALNSGGEGVALAAANTLCAMCKSGRAVEVHLLPSYCVADLLGILHIYHASQAMINVGITSVIRQRLSSNDAQLQARCAELAALFASDRRALANLREGHAVAALAECLFSQNKSTGSNALSALSRLISASASEPGAVAALGSDLQAAGGVLALVNIMTSAGNAGATQEQAVTCLAELVLASPPCREQLISDNVTPTLLSHMSLRSPTALQTVGLLFKDPRVAQKVKGEELRSLMEVIMSRDANLTRLASAALIALLERANLWSEVTALGGLDVLFLLAGSGNAAIEQHASDLIVHLAKNRDPAVKEFLGRPHLSALLQSGSPRIQTTLLAIFSTVPKVCSFSDMFSYNLVRLGRTCMAGDCRRSSLSCRASWQPHPQGYTSYSTPLAAHNSTVGPCYPSNDRGDLR